MKLMTSIISFFLCVTAFGFANDDELKIFPESGKQIVEFLGSEKSTSSEIYQSLQRAYPMGTPSSSPIQSVLKDQSYDSRFSLEPGKSASTVLLSDPKMFHVILKGEIAQAYYDVLMTAGFHETKDDQKSTLSEGRISCSRIEIASKVVFNCDLLMPNQP